MLKKLVFFLFLIPTPIFSHMHSQPCDENIGRNSLVRFNEETGKTFFYKKGKWDETKRFRYFESSILSPEKGCQTTFSYADCKLGKIRWTYTWFWEETKPRTRGETVLKYVCS